MTEGSTIPTLSVVIPMWNEQQVIASCLDRLLAQEDELEEIIVVDNGSTDDSPRIVAELAKAHPKITLLHESRSGVAYARNAGFDHARSDLFGRIDADTHVADNWAHEARACFAEDPQGLIGAVSGLSVPYDSPLASRHKAAIEKLVAQGKLGGGMQVHNIHGANMVIRASTWAHVRDHVSMRRDVHEDIDLALTIVDSTDLKIIQTERLWAEVSGRRAKTSPWAYWGYCRATIRTFELHGPRSKREMLWIYRRAVEHLIAHTVEWPVHVVFSRHPHHQARDMPVRFSF